MSGATTLRAVLCGLFIALIALFRTSPVGEGGKGDKPVPLPPELGIEDFSLGALDAHAPAPAAAPAEAGQH
ncbi:MAG: hypothetical protein V4693_03640 [Pseudomonadota bacterium]